MDDKTVLKKYGKKMVPEADTHNLNMIRLGMVASTIAERLPDLGRIKEVVSVTLSGNTNNYKSSPVDTQLAHITNLRDAMKEDDADIPDEVEYIAKHTGLTKPSALKVDALQALIDSVTRGEDPLVGLASPGDKSAARARQMLKDAIKEIEEKKDSFYRSVELKRALVEYQKQLFFAISKQPGMVDKEAIYRNALYQEVNNAFLALNDLMVINKPTFKKGFLDTVNSLTTVDDEHAFKLHQVITESEQRGRDEIRSILAKHNKLLEELMKDRGVNIGARVLFGDQAKNVFNDMLEDNASFDPASVENWMKFKDPDDPKWNLSDAQKNYIRFFNSTVRDVARQMYTKTQQNEMFPDEETRAKIMGTRVPTWKEGYIPIIPQAATKTMRDTLFLRRGSEVKVKDFVEAFGKVFKSFTKPVEDGRVKDMEPWSLTEIFLPQIDTNPGRGSHEVREMLGIDANNNIIKERGAIETNPALILNLFVVEAARKEHMGHAAFAAEALDAKLVADSMFPGVEAKPIREFLTNIAMLRIHNKVDKEDKTSRVLDAAKKFGSLHIFGGSIRQFVADGLMTGYNLSANTVGGMIGKFLFKYDTRYDPKDLNWAAKHMTTPFGHQLMVDFGMFNSSLGEFTLDDYVGTRNKSLWQTKNLMAHFRMVLRTQTQNVILAQMHKDGLTEKAYVPDKETGLYVYDENKDDRFYVYSPDEDIPGQQENPPAPGTVDFEKWIKWKAVREELGREGAIVKGKMVRPYTTKELIVMKQFAIKLFGALDGSEAMAAEISATGRAVLTFKKWARHRWQNFWTPTHKSLKEGYWAKIYDDDGNLVKMDFIAGEFEGLMQSIGGLWMDIMRLGWSEALSKASRVRKENLSKLIGDLIFALAMYNIWLWVEETEIIPETLKKELQAGVSNAIGDIFIPATAWNSVVDSSPMAMASIIGRSAKTAWSTFTFGITGDWDKAAESADNLFKVSAVYRTIKTGTEIVTG